jgi:multidrug efflux pump subunit AcrA (membrane-fusion protein)
MTMDHNHPAYRIFTAQQRIRLPRPLRTLMVLVLAGIVIGFLLLSIVPWVQTAYGAGRITALHPDSQLQQIHALVEGRISHWHVRDGARVKRGDPIVDLVDNDPDRLLRLETEKEAAQNKLNAARIATETAKRNLDRQERLQAQGLSSRKEYEQALITYKTWRSSEAEAVQALANSESRLSTQFTQRVTAPKDGRIVRTYAGASATFVKPGQLLADFMPADAVPAVELYVAGVDMPLVQPGQKVRLQFEGWPIVQFSGWPSQAVGTFGGVVSVVDPAVAPDGRLRVLVTEPEDEPWPEEKYLAFGARAQGWVLLSTVTLGYEIWRQLNSFPPENPNAIRPNTQAGAGSV